MNVEEIRSFALSFDGASESFPFGEETLVFKINNKIFLLVSLEAHSRAIQCKMRSWRSNAFTGKICCSSSGISHE